MADDMRHLQRTEIAEVAESFAAEQVGSSTMPHKRNPVSFENVKSMWKAMAPRVMTTYLDQISEQCVVVQIEADLPLFGRQPSRPRFGIVLSGFRVEVQKSLALVVDTKVDAVVEKVRELIPHLTDERWVLPPLIRIHLLAHDQNLHRRDTLHLA